MTKYVIILILAICGTNSAPLDGPVRIELLTEKASGLVEQANQKLTTLSDVALQNAAAINELVSSNLVAVGDTISTGYTATTGAVKETLQSASEMVNQQLETAGKVARQTGTLISDTAAQGAQTLSNSITTVTNQKANVLTSVLDQVRSLTPKFGVLADPPRKIESAVLEQEDLGSKVLTAKESIGTFFSGIFQPVPIVDTITEEEKYGNTGDKFETVGKALVNGSESLASLLSTAAGLPVEFVKKITRTASASLNNLGGRLIGLT